uniref:Large ribosomal subunit protein P2 n=1 Tax=Schistosoma japonicum TaxID=6182 RepID=Q5D9J5_SCHJA|nr:unknown [Schistosoma japonicum]CAX78984.1 ribosomal protein, large P2 [Schistosoma japonicum]CAX78985.1 ribosomal protein, large P2 [Schistosoma japonicum]CAX78986.1 ribosomal protein, large P2 [Schistosoma japonicum]CAX78990.1 ribosomal protein, large P2 [Schistosoma japonicum]
MRYLAAFLLCQLGGKEKPTENDIKTVLNSVGIEHDSERLTKLLASLSGKDIPQLIAEGSQKLSSVPTAGAAVSAPSSAPTPAKAEVPKAESKPAKTEVKEESESEEDMGFGLFD